MNPIRQAIEDEIIRVSPEIDSRQQAYLTARDGLKQQAEDLDKMVAYRIWLKNVLEGCPE